MKNIADHNKRTMWFHGDPGPMVPKEGKSKKRLAVYDKKLTKDGKKKAEKETNGKDKVKTSSLKKASKKEKGETEKVPRSPVKTRRLTRKTLAELPDKPVSKKKSKTVKKEPSQNELKNKKKPISKGKGKSAANGVSSAEVPTKGEPVPVKSRKRSIKTEQVDTEISDTKLAKR